MAEPNCERHPITKNRDSELEREDCIIGDVNWRGTLTEDAKLVEELFRSTTEEQVKTRIKYFFTKRTCKGSRKYYSVIDDQTIFHLLSRPIPSLLTTIISGARMLDKTFPDERIGLGVVKMLHKIIVEDQDEEVINEIINSEIKDHELNLVKVLRFKSYVSGKTALETAKCERQINPNDERIKLMVEILTRLEEKLVQSEAGPLAPSSTRAPSPNPAPPSPPEPLTDSEDSSDSVDAEGNNDSDEVRNLKRKITKYEILSSFFNENIRTSNEEIERLNGSSGDGNQIKIERLESDIRVKEKLRDQSLAKKAELEEELEDLIKAEERAKEFPNVVKIRNNKKGGKKSKKRKSTRKSRKTNKRRAKK
jgi:hypothetical protein